VSKDNPPSQNHTSRKAGGHKYFEEECLALESLSNSVPLAKLHPSEFLRAVAEIEKEHVHSKITPNKKTIDIGGVQLIYDIAMD